MRTILSLKNVHKTFELGTINENHVLKGLSLDVMEGDFISVIGGNGAGKSTLMNVIAGVLQADMGQIVLEDTDITTQPVRKRSKKISRVFQDTKMGTASRMTIEQNLAIAMKRGQSRGLSWGVKEKNRTFYQEVLKELDLGLENRLKTSVEFLSGGQRQALTLLMASLASPKLLLLDEHTAALDPKTSEMVMALTEKIVTQHHLTTIMITHNMENAIRYGNRLIMLQSGRVVVDIAGEEKKHLTVPQLMELFHQRSGEFMTSDSLILS
ncbi:ATP-binding cassette domain-containing protein [Carnobacteriaceae bacterium zg-84]|uniref:ABC transporter ATP-binding protein n=1 Tax=Granulicatella sp. zg-84 TaxID=2678503 RepID=UPI0013C19695|nr:ATP-binding cassette domain-containing protein [Granulicatella sp. zg-84]NEW65604.1 ATP-binding cassette domain-containing protein [Granulicatella sp. zg-84]QMI85754.1 ATP-binding cassette domain-containing protein [Carnobacteriaceae bacterium zg-84]